ncbi:MAG: lipase family protein [Blastocatellia bacterium]|nr:lipase family protein [Blastocatellia bacterium]
MPAPTLECRLLAASNVAYAISQTGDLATQPKLTQYQQYFDGIGFTGTPKAFVDGPAGINACLVGTNADGVILAFRGTTSFDLRNPKSILDWLSDFDARQIAVPEILAGVEVHEGFWKALNFVWDELLPEVIAQLAALGNDARLLITGHSKGGAMAQLAAFRLAYSQAQIRAARIYTFAAARAGDRVFVQAYNKEFQDVSIRYEFAEDMVPHLPPSVEFLKLLQGFPEVAKEPVALDKLDYESVKTLRYIDRDGHISGDSFLLEIKRLGRIVKLLTQGKLKQIGDDHAIGCGGGYATNVCPRGLCDE